MLGVAMLGLAHAGEDSGMPGAALVFSLLDAGAWPCLYLAAAAGWGRLARPLIAGASSAASLQWGVGLALLLSISHAAGWAGALGGKHGAFVAWGIVGAGLALLGHQLLVGLRRHGGGVYVPALHWTLLLCVPGLGVLLVAACSPPGWLWDSEFGGFDALSYHLQLPQEWLRDGRLAPLEHNVYSFLPGYVEAAYMHLGAMLTPIVGRHGLVGGNGQGALACQLLHAGLGAMTAILSARVAHALVSRAGGGHAAARTCAGVAGTLVLSTPWVIVVGSLAYNEMGVTALAAAAGLAACDDRLSPVRRGALAGFLVGVACGCKPTAILLAAPCIAALLLVHAPARLWPRLVLPGIVAGLLALSPWLARNWAASGNPVFPHAASVFGTGHWDAEQVDRYARAHAFTGSWSQRLRLTVRPDPHDPAAPPPRHRGVMHPQWGACWPLVLAAGVLIAGCPLVRRTGAALCLGIGVSLALWLGATHVQSRFLVPLVVPGAWLIALALWRAWILLGRAGTWVAPAAGALAVAGSGAWSVAQFAAQRAGRPNAMLVAGVPMITGESLRPVLAAAPPRAAGELLASASPEVFCNLTLSPGDRVLLVGDATPFYYTVPVVYATTWDRSPLARAILDAPDQPEAWTARLVEAGITHALINLDELERLKRSGTIDPALSPAAIEAWGESLGAPAMGWARPGRVLFRLLPADDDPPTTGGAP